MSPILSRLTSGGSGGFGFGKKGGSTAYTGPITTIAQLNSSLDWGTFPNGGNYTGNYNDTYYGSRGTISGGDGSLRMNNYEYSLYTKFSCRTSANNTGVFQVHNYGGTLTDFNNFYGGTNPGNMFMMGLLWSDPTGLTQTNSILTTALGSGNAAYIVTGGTGSRSWGFYGGGASYNSDGQGTTNRETLSTVNWANKDQLTFIVYGDSTTNHSRKVRVFVGETLAYQFTSQPPVSTSTIYMLFGFGYPNGGATLYDNINMKVRYAQSTNQTINI